MSNCVRCNVEITDEVLQHTYYDEAHPEINIGPYCIDCITQVRICSGCHKPHIIDENIKYFGDGLHYCEVCAEDITACDSCNKIRTIHETVDGVKYCQSCFDANFKRCDCCNEIKSVERFNCLDPLSKARNSALFEDYSTICDECFMDKKNQYPINPIRECEHCSSIYAETSTTHPRYCPSCIGHLSSCTICGEVDHNLRSYETRGADGQWKNYLVCHKCTPKIKRCTSCSDYTTEFKVLHGRAGEAVVCHSCLSNDLKECPSCLQFRELGENGECSKCNSRYTRNVCGCGDVRDEYTSCRSCGDHQSHVYNYTFRPHPQFHYTKRDKRQHETLFFGIENECTYPSRESLRGAIKKSYKKLDPRFIHWKSDASISGPGAEMVTQPMTLDFFHKMDLSPIFYRTMQNSESCGMHIHVSRGAFQGDLHIYRVTKFIHDYNTFINEVAGRSYNNYNKRLNEKVSKYIKQTKKAGRDWADRHVRVNLRNEKTIEFRMFAGCTKEKEMRYRVEFLHALIKWTTDLGISQVKKSKFIDYVEENQKLYPNFHNFIVNQ